MKNALKTEMGAYFSPAANDGNDGNRSGCFGRGDSLHDLLRNHKG
jgi:hypothetical protein